MKQYRWQILFGVLLVAVSGLLYGLHYALFRDAHHILIYLVGDIAFVPMEVLLVTLVFHEVLARRERKARMQKMNMAIGLFFSEIGNDLLRRFLLLDQKADAPRAACGVTAKWTAKEYRAAKAALREHRGAFHPDANALASFRVLLVEKRGFLLTLLENPNLLEHELFTDLLWSVFHLMEELCHRDNFNALPDTDTDHLVGDMRRAYGNLLTEWLQYMLHLQKEYPYLFSLATRTNPFMETVDARVKA